MSTSYSEAVNRAAAGKEITPDQLFSLRPTPECARYRTPVESLYLCGSGVHPGGGVMGAPGHNAAKALLSDWEKK